MQHRPAAPSHLILPVGQPGQEVPDSFLHCLSGPQAQVASGLFDAVFWHAKPKTVIITTPNREYNPVFGMPEGRMRHRDHRFE